MKGDTSNTDGNDGIKESERRRLYLLLVGLLAAVAIILVIISPRGSGLSSCNAQIYQSAKQSCIEALATSTGNSTLCASLPVGYADTCYITIAENRTDPAICSRISSDNLSAQCYTYIANYTRNPQLCMEIGGNRSAGCLFELGTETNSTGTCGMINGPLAVGCNDTINFNGAVSSEKPKYCAAITSNNSTNDSSLVFQSANLGAYQNLGFELGQIFAYSAYSNATIGTRDLCYFSLAYLSSNETYCSSITGSTLGSECATALNTTQSNATALNFTALQDLCSSGAYSNVTGCDYTILYLKAAETGNVSICKSMADPYSYQCYFTIAEKYNSTTYCNYIDNSTVSGECDFSIENPDVNLS